MTEKEWLECADLASMLEFLQEEASERKLRLLACACCRRIWHIVAALPREVVEVAEQHADGIASRKELTAALAAGLDPTSDSAVDFAIDFAAVDFRRATPVSAVLAAAGYAADAAVENFSYSKDNVPRSKAKACEHAAQCSVLRDIFGNPFHSVTISCTCFTPTVLSLAQSIYADRSFTLLPILADALEDAGCTDPDILAHCRQPGEHVRGCWVVDLILGKQ